MTNYTQEFRNYNLTNMTQDGLIMKYEGSPYFCSLERATYYYGTQRYYIDFSDMDGRAVIHDTSRSGEQSDIDASMLHKVNIYLKAAKYAQRKIRRNETYSKIYKLSRHGEYSTAVVIPQLVDDKTFVFSVGSCGTNIYFSHSTPERHLTFLNNFIWVMEDIKSIIINKPECIE